MRMILVLALALSVVTLSACSGGGTGKGIPNAPPLVNGTITKIEASRYLVEEKPGQQSGDAKCWFALTGKTTVYRQEGKEIKPAKAADLAVGQQVSAWAGGPVRESYPCQADAAVILLFGPGAK